MFEFLLLMPILVLLSFTWPLVSWDLREHRLPNKYTLSLFIVTAISLLSHGIAKSEWQRLSQSLLAMGVTFVIGWLLAKYADLGAGDVKLLIPLNGWLAWHDPWLIALSLTIGLLTANGLALAIWLKRKDPKEHIALGPFLLLGFYLAAFQPSVQIITAVGESLA
jgi:leader peptidase (prepilin peptidase)/N-methyltransferase